MLGFSEPASALEAGQSAQEREADLPDLAPRSTLILLIPPQILFVHREIAEVSKRNGFKHHEEIEPKAGCRRFKLW